jgi:hypothetical protein
VQCGGFYTLYNRASIFIVASVPTHHNIAARRLWRIENQKANLAAGWDHFVILVCIGSGLLLNPPHLLKALCIS